MKRMWLGVRLIYLVLFISSATCLASDEFNYERLIGLIRARNIRSIDALLPLLPEELRTQFVLVYKSRSLQEGSLESPRAILYGKTGKLVITFNGDPRQKGYGSLEVMQFREKPLRHSVMPGRCGGAWCAILAPTRLVRRSRSIIQFN
jgi:hypothetical protein